MAEVSEIEAGGEVRTVKDTTARQGVAANTQAIEEINEKIPTAASASNKLLTKDDLPTIGTVIKSAEITTNSTVWATRKYTFASPLSKGKWQLYVMVTSTTSQDVMLAISSSSFGGNTGIASDPNYDAHAIPLPYLLDTPGTSQITLSVAQKTATAVKSKLIAVKMA